MEYHIATYTCPKGCQTFLTLGEMYAHHAERHALPLPTRLWAREGLELPASLNGTAPPEEPA